MVKSSKYIYKKSCPSKFCESGIVNFDKINYFDPGYQQTQGPLQPDFDVLAPTESELPETEATQ